MHLSRADTNQVRVNLAVVVAQPVDAREAARAQCACVRLDSSVRGGVRHEAVSVDKHSAASMAVEPGRCFRYFNL
jgi:hypothetical protein